VPFVVIAIVTFSISSHSVHAASAVLRYELSLEVVVSGERYRGKGVWELSIRTKTLLLPGPVPYDETVRGEAILLASDHGHQLMALKRSNLSLADLTYSALIVPCLPPWSTAKEMVELLAVFDGGCIIDDAAPEIIEVPPSATSPIVRIPFSGEQGVRTEGQTVEQVTVSVHTTEAPVSLGIAEKLPRGFLSRLDSIFVSGVVRNRYYLEDFTTELKP
jgi:hypothetical protein